MAETAAEAASEAAEIPTEYGHSERPKSLSEPKSSIISIHNIHYTVPVKAKCCTTVDKAILQDISGVFKPGMNAILGPTGSGKTSLLDILAGRKDPRGLSGTVLVDGNRQPSNFKCMTGYVVQNDVVMGTLTVRENFMFSANLRLPSSLTKQNKVDRVEDLLNELGLSHCAESKVGTELIRGVSGGERKRTNIGMELVISPPVLFLDEPTTGLDSSTANAVIKLLQRQAQKGRTIIFSIHQPRYSIYKRFDNLLMLSLGRMVYHGPSDQALDYFSSIGYVCEEHNNPPDFFLDVINGDSTAVNSMARETKLNIKDVDGDAVEMNEVGVEVDTEEGQKEKALAERLAEDYLRSNLWDNVEREIEPVFKEYQSMKEHKENIPANSGAYATSFFTQLRYVAQRTFLNIVRNPQTSIMQNLLVTLFSLLVGIIYLQLDDVLPAALQNRLGATFFIIMQQVFSNISSVALFIRERVIFMHETSSGFYRVSAYFLAKLVCDILPLRLIPSIIYSVITYFMIGFQLSASKFFIYWLTLFLTSVCASSIGFLVGSCFSIFVMANLVLSLIYVLSMVFGGFLVSLDSVVVWMRWLKYLSVFRYGLSVLQINELKDLVLCHEIQANNATEVIKSCDNTTSGAKLEEFGHAYETDWDLWQNEVALVCLTLIFLTLTYIRLVTLKKFK